ncbi:MAG: adenosylmethionine--8-amino-7-oxononanoate transaminase [Thermodesulfovibrionales bacterium]
METPDRDLLIDFDRRYLWHPFTQMSEWMRDDPLIITEGRDCFLKDISGRWYLDGVSSLWVNLFGHRRKEIDEALKAQIDRISHTTLLGLSSVPAIELAARLISLTDASFSGLSPRLARVFFSDNGSTAVEVGLKMAFQYWRHRDRQQKQRFLCLNNAYHGDTLGAVSVGNVAIFHAAFGPLLFQTLTAPSPYCYRCELGLSPGSCGIACAHKAADIIRGHHEELAGFILEPLVQAAGGMITAPPGYLRIVRDACAAHGVLLIADEVATGFGRTGRMFACEHEAVVPDILCLSKGITGGYLPLAATLCTDEIYSAFLGEFRDLKTFFHGHSYTGNPLGCAAALACLGIFAQDRVLESLQPKISLLHGWLQEAANLPHVGDARQCGLMAGVELVRDKPGRVPYDWEEKIGWKAALAARSRGVIIRPLGNVVVIMPPLSISEENLRQMLAVLFDSIAEATS